MKSLLSDAQSHSGPNIAAALPSDEACQMVMTALAKGKKVIMVYEENVELIVRVVDTEGHVQVARLNLQTRESGAGGVRELAGRKNPWSPAVRQWS